MRIRPRPWLLILAGFTCGCSGVPRGTADAERPKTLLTWAAGKESADKKPNGDGMGNGGRNGDGGEGGDPKVERSPGSDGRDDPLVTDRPDFTEASSTVGKGRIQLEAGYTYVRDRSGGATTNGHSYPEALLRVGVLADWLEFRVGQNFGNTRTGAALGVFGESGGGGTSGADSAGGPAGAGTGRAASRMNGAEDLYLGAKFALTEQKRALPETALILQGTVPTGCRDLTAGEVQPGVNFLYSWTVIEDRLSLGGSLQANRAIDDTGHGYVEVAQSLTVGYGLTDKLGAYTEWFAFYPSGAIAPGVGPQHFFNGGFTYQFTPNLQFDIRAGVGLNRRADDFFVGTGFAVRY